MAAQDYSGGTMRERSCPFSQVGFVVICICMLLGTLLLLGCAEADQGASGTVIDATDAYADGGTNEGMSRFPTGPKSGLWAGNVETIPASPTALPDSFYEKPQGDPVPYPMGVELRPSYSVSFKNPQDVGTPLWVFADALDKQRLDEVVEQAVNEQRVVVVYGRHYKDLVGFVAPPGPDAYIAGFGLVLAWAPWNKEVPDVALPYYFTPPELDLPTKEAIYMAMAFQTLIELRPKEGSAGQ